MKKIFAVFLAIFAMAYFSMPAFACQDGSDGSLPMTSDNSTSVGLSANVIAKYCAGGTNGTSYSAATYNPKGTGKTYGIASDSTTIVYKDGLATGQSTIPGNFGTSGDSSDFSGWTHLGE